MSTIHYYAHTYNMSNFRNIWATAEGLLELKCAGNSWRRLFFCHGRIYHQWENTLVLWPFPIAIGS